MLAGPKPRRAASCIRSPITNYSQRLTEMVDWARATGFRVVAAGKGTKYLPAYHEDVTAKKRLEPLRAHRGMKRNRLG